MAAAKEVVFIEKIGGMMEYIFSSKIWIGR
jgi:hypothetical protein